MTKCSAYFLVSQCKCSEDLLFVLLLLRRLVCPFDLPPGATGYLWYAIVAFSRYVCVLVVNATLTMLTMLCSNQLFVNVALTVW